MSEPPPGPGRSRRLLASVLAATALVGGCATPAPYIAVNHQAVVALSAPEVWTREHAFLQDQGFQVLAEDRSAGLIDARLTTPDKGLVASFGDCGRSALLAPPQERQTLDLTLRIQPADGGARVDVHAAVSRTLRARHAAALTVACSSTGVVEAAVLKVASGQPMEAAVVPR